MSVLVITGINCPTYAIRGATQTLTPIGASVNMRRTVNGTLVNLADTQFEKYASTITCTDQAAPSLDGIWPGETVTVQCIARLSYATSGGSATRTVVSGSTEVDGATTFYRPQLTMMVTGYEVLEDEYGAEVGWTLTLEEV